MEGKELFDKRSEVFCDKRNHSKWCLEKVERQVYNKEHGEPSLFEEENLTISNKISTFISGHLNKFNKILADLSFAVEAEPAA